MHGRLKVRSSEEEKLRKSKEREKKVILYRAALEKVFKKRADKEYDDEALKITSEMLIANPDISTLWNYRREILLFMATDQTDETSASTLFDAELQLTEYCLKVNPKSYCAWHQRIWILDTRKNPDWNKELKLCSAYLNLDERNFHCWDYRRQIVSRSKTSSEKEFDYSTEKIKENFSNYSAWHYRSKLLTHLFPDTEGLRAIEEKSHRSELELVINAAFTDPNDTSAWFYQRWLLGSISPPLSLAVCRITSEKSYISFNKSVPCPSLNDNLKIEIDDNNISGSWKSVFGLKNDVIWILEHDLPQQINTSSKIMVVLSCDGESQPVCCNYSSENEFVGYVSVDFGNHFGKSVIEELNSQRESCEQLLQLEPDSKWTLLTLAVIKHSIEPMKYYDSCIDTISQLFTLDSKRVNYYKDLLSRWHSEYILQSDLDIVKQGKFFSGKRDLNEFKISKLYHLQYWSACSNVDLSGQQLASNCLPMLRVLQNCQVLDLSNNSLKTLQGFPFLPKLHKLILTGNEISDGDVEKYLEKYKDTLPVIIFDK